MRASVEQLHCSTEEKYNPLEGETCGIA